MISARHLAYRLATVGVLAILVAATAGCGERPTSAEGTNAADEPLRVGLVPNQEPDKVKAEYAPLAQYMEQRLGRKVELTVPTGYPAVVEAMANDQLDLALFGGLTYVQARQRARVSPLVTDINPETGTTKYDSAVIVPADSPARRRAPAQKGQRASRERPRRMSPSSPQARPAGTTARMNSGTYSCGCSNIQRLLDA